MCPVLVLRPGIPGLRPLSQSLLSKMSSIDSACIAGLHLRQVTLQNINLYPHRNTLSSGLSDAPRHISDLLVPVSNFKSPLLHLWEQT